MQPSLPQGIMRKKSNRTFGENKPNQTQFQSRSQMTDDRRQRTRAFLPSHYLVELCRGDDRMSLFKMQGYESRV